MINTTRTRKKYIIKDHIPSSTGVPNGFDNCTYTVKVNGKQVFTGNPTVLGDIEVDVSDFIEQYLENAYLYELTVPLCVVEVVFYATRESGGYYQNTKRITYQPENISLDPVFQIGMIGGSATGTASVFNNSDNMPIAIAIYPIYYFKWESMYTRGLAPIRITGDSYFDPYPEFISAGTSEMYKYSLASQKGITQDDWDNTIKNRFLGNVIYEIDPQVLKGYTPLYHSPAFMLQLQKGGPFIELPLDKQFTIGKIMPAMEAILVKEFNSFDEVRDLNNFTFNFTEDELKYYFTDQSVDTYINTINGTSYTDSRGGVYSNIKLTPNGYGYKIITLYKGTSRSPWDGEWGLWSSEMVRVPKVDECTGANIVLINSGYCMGGKEWNNTHPFRLDPYPGVDSEGHPEPPIPLPKDVVVPLMVKNGMLVGKTNNLLEKTTYVDRYGDEHNSIMSNHYEIECYIDSEWLKPTTTNDQNYEKVMMALQNAKKTYLCCNAGISGIDGDNNMIEGHIKNVEKIETYSSYSSSKQLTYKITFEVYE